ncbi:aryl-alcohol dehydrogenase-like predicted oxidoreductase [Rhizobium lentis]|uniref:Aryl-alcohol dehydrogenase-like predicted oxidoreductase n=2 Tax=Rhizobium lentis TaxID=1138194 RepID=A0A7W9CYS9_9HYPH|nr:aryl-alcohol dehydrogenase-like predicted oxidoreductase [Rhizobium lentis]MBB5553964.1 aryl-alcohol dehydrogenase-like predicted oxidoreductase [Rhizobium lentis]MBB5564526.1 aryl-alcohol dehydrogenase-like predicted oxidoreductase [Rhizobium lentis]MBB5571042.1 aryl-alcohol dehydrogenase-like predicted oxidoreductase [Rhizobium lentis]
MRRLARWLGDTHRRPKIGIKLGRPYEAGRPVSRVAADDISKEFEAATALLGFAPDAIMIKDPPTALLHSRDLHAFLKTVAVRLNADAMGIATHNLDVTDLPQTTGGILQIEYNGIQWHRALPSLREAKLRGWIIWGMQPLAYGFLATRNATDPFSDDDLRSRFSESVKVGLCAMSNGFHKSFEEYSGFSRAERALAFCLCSPSVDRVVIGPRSVPQLRSSLRALTLATYPEFRNAVQRQLGSAEH